MKQFREVSKSVAIVKDGITYREDLERLFAKCLEAPDGGPTDFLVMACPRCSGANVMLVWTGDGFFSVTCDPCGQLVTRLPIARRTAPTDIPTQGPGVIQ